MSIARFKLVAVLTILLLSVTSATTPAKAADQKTKLEHLLVHDLGDEYRVHFDYDPALVELIMEREVIEGYITRVKVARFSFTPGGKKYILGYDSGGSMDPSFSIYRDPEGTEEYPFDMGSGLTATLRGDGYLDLTGHINSYGDWIRRTEEREGRLHHVKAPFDYMGLASKALVPLEIYASPEEKEVVGRVAVGEPVTVLLHEYYWSAEGSWEDVFLLKIEPGVVGWWMPKKENNFKAEELEGLFQRID